MHRGGGERLESCSVDRRQVNAVPQPIDGPACFGGDSRFFIQCHSSLTAEKGLFLSKSFETVVFSHGKESGPWGSKITAMAETVRKLGFAVESVDYRGMDDPAARVAKLIEEGKKVAGPVVLVGSSMGGHVSAAAALKLNARGLFLLAPAFYMPGYEKYTPQDVGAPTAIVHGWHDDIVSVDNSIRWSREHLAALHVLDSDHRLENKIPQICRLLGEFLSSLTS
jgi:alpha/beta superfamily hydrolase